MIFYIILYNMNKRQVILVILDGWGIGPKNEANPIHIQGTPNINYLKENFPLGALQASGISAGLPWNEEGNSEVGHLTIGAGKVLYQHYPRITISIQDGTFAKNEVFLKAFEHAKKFNSAVNFAGLITEGNIHASLDHLIALIKLAKNNNVPKINLHLFSDGKDSQPKSFPQLFDRLQKEAGGWNLGSLSGRFYGLDRDSHYERTQLAYQAMLGTGPSGKTAEQVAEEAYGRDLSDQYLEPHTIDPDACVKNDDALIFFDFREDGIRQTAGAFILENFSAFPTNQFSNLYVCTMTRYSDTFSAPVAYPPETINESLGKIISENGKTQIRIAETEKYAHVTYFFNGYKEQPLPNEYRVIIPSEKIFNHADKPKMRSEEITSRTIQVIQEKSFDFALVNYANGDLIAHTGNYEAAKIAVKAIDDAVGELTRAALANNSILIITSDHGNIELMTDPKTGEAATAHDLSAVPIYLVGSDFMKQKSLAETELAEKEIVGILSDIAPTILELLEIPKPDEMTGQSLLKILI